MRQKFLSIIIVFFSLLSVSELSAQEFFDTSDSEKFFTFSGRLGFNTSNKTFPTRTFNKWNHNSWGTGLNIGFLANLNFKEYLSLQPGIFVESRSGDYSYLTEYINYAGQVDTHYEMGHLRGYYLTVPVMGIFKFNFSEHIKWSVEFGPYFQLGLKQTGVNNVIVIYRLPGSNNYSQYKASHNTMDAGVKLGSGLQFYNHYYLGFHYLIGLCDAWKEPEGGRNKSWVFTLGYDF